MNNEREDKYPILETGTEKDEVTEDDRQLAIMCHVLGLITGVFTPLIYCLSKQGDSEFLRHHETEALNFQLTMIFIWGITIGLDVFISQSMFLIPVAVLIDIVLSISGAVKAKDGICYKYPISIPFIRRKKQPETDDSQPS